MDARKVPNITILVLVVFVLFFAGLNTGPFSDKKVAHAASEPNWRLTWSEEFNGSGSPDWSNWICDSGTGYPATVTPMQTAAGAGKIPNNWGGNGELEVYACGTDNLWLSDGNLNIKVIHMGSDPLSGWTSGRIETMRTDFMPRDGGLMMVEARIQMPDLIPGQGQGFWPAFWMMGAPFRGNYKNWPSVGEIDIMESINARNVNWGVFHCGTSSGGPCFEPSGLGGSVTSFVPTLQDDFHTYRLEIDRSATPQILRWYVDGVQFYAVSQERVDMPTWLNAIDHGFFILLNVAVGGSWPGDPSADTVSGGTMKVDYVRVYNAEDLPMFIPLVRFKP